MVLDDRATIVENPSIRTLWPPWTALQPPRLTTASGRPLLNFTFAVNYALGIVDGLLAQLRAGDADQDFDCDQLDLVQVLQAGKYLMELMILLICWIFILKVIPHLIQLVVMTLILILLIVLLTPIHPVQT